MGQLPHARQRDELLWNDRRAHAFGHTLHLNVSEHGWVYDVHEGFGWSESHQW